MQETKPRQLSRTGVTSRTLVRNRGQREQTEIKTQIKTQTKTQLKTQTSVINSKDTLVTKDNKDINENQKEKQTGQSKKRGTIFLKSVLNACKRRILSDSFDKIRAKYIHIKERTKIFGMKMKNCINKKINDNKISGFRQILHINLEKIKETLKKNLDFNEKYGIKNTQYLTNILQRYLKNNKKVVFTKLLINKNFTKKLQQFNKTKKIRALNNLFKKRKATAFQRLLINLQNSKKFDPKLFLLVMRMLQKKLRAKKLFVFQTIKKSTQKRQLDAPQQDKKNLTLKQLKQNKQIDKLEIQTQQIKTKYQNDLNTHNKKKQTLTEKLQQLKAKNDQLEESIKNYKQQFKATQNKCTLPQIYQNIYYNFLFFLKQSQQDLSRQKLLKSLLTPMTNLDIPIDTIKQQNECLLQILNHYRKLKINLPKPPPKVNWAQNKPYQFLLKQNSDLYSALSVLIENSKSSKNDKQFSDLIKDFSQLEQKFVKVRLSLDEGN